MKQQKQHGSGASSSTLSVKDAPPSSKLAIQVLPVTVSMSVDESTPKHVDDKQILEPLSNDLETPVIENTAPSSDPPALTENDEHSALMGQDLIDTPAKQDPVAESEHDSPSARLKNMQDVLRDLGESFFANSPIQAKGGSNDPNSHVDDSEKENFNTFFPFPSGHDQIEQMIDSSLLQASLAYSDENDSPLKSLSPEKWQAWSSQKYELLRDRNASLIKEIRFAEQTCVEISQANAFLESKVERLEMQLQAEQEAKNKIQDKLERVMQDDKKMDHDSLESLKEKLEKEHQLQLESAQQRNVVLEREIKAMQRRIDKANSSQQDQSRSVAHMARRIQELESQNHLLKRQAMDRNEAPANLSEHLSPDGISPLREKRPDPSPVARKLQMVVDASVNEEERTVLQEAQAENQRLHQELIEHQEFAKHLEAKLSARPDADGDIVHSRNKQVDLLNSLKMELNETSDKLAKSIAKVTEKENVVDELRGQLLKIETEKQECLTMMLALKNKLSSYSQRREEERQSMELDFQQVLALATQSFMYKAQAMETTLTTKIDEYRIRIVKLTLMIEKLRENLDFDVSSHDSKEEPRVFSNENNAGQERQDIPVLDATFRCNPINESILEHMEEARLSTSLSKSEVLDTSVLTENDRDEQSIRGWLKMMDVSHVDDTAIIEVRKLQASLASAQERIESHVATIMLLEKEIEELTTDHKRTNSKLHELQSIISSDKAVIAELRVRIKSSENRRADLESELDLKSRDLERAVVSCHQLEKRIHESSSPGEVQELRSSLELAESEIDRLRIAFVACNDKLAAAYEELSEKEITLRGLSESVDRSSSLEGEIVRLTSALSEREQALTQLAVVKADLQKTLEDTTSTLISVTAERDSARHENLEVERNLVARTKELDDLRKQVAHSTELFLEQKECVSSLEKQLAAALFEKEELGRRISKAEKELESSASEFTAYRRCMEDRIAERQSVLQEVQSFSHSRQSELREKISNLETTASKLHGLIEELAAERAEMESALENERETKESLELQLAEAMTELQNAASEVATTSKELVETQDAIETLQRALCEKTEVVQRLTKERDDAHTKLVFVTGKLEEASFEMYVNTDL
jgi:chromosome segregation ATPase